MTLVAHLGSLEPAIKKSAAATPSMYVVKHSEPNYFRCQVSLITRHCYSSPAVSVGAGSRPKWSLVQPADPVLEPPLRRRGSPRRSGSSFPTSLPTPAGRRACATAFLTVLER